MAEGYILIVEDELPIAQGVAFHLRRGGYRVEIAEDGESALDKVFLDPPDLIILDLMLPGLDGFSFCSRLRRRYDIPVIILSARTSEEDRLSGFEVGADDYVTKPFSAAELIARVKAVLRRVQGGKTPEGPTQLASGPIRLDLESRKVWIRDQEVHLSRKEFDLLALFLQHPNRVFTRDQLLKTVWEDSAEWETRTIDTHIHWLRKKLEDNPRQPRYLQTVPGVGYRFVP